MTKLVNCEKGSKLTPRQAGGGWRGVLQHALCSGPSEDRSLLTRKCPSALPPQGALPTDSRSGAAVADASGQLPRARAWVSAHALGPAYC